MSEKKILFISHDPFSEVGSNGKTYSSLFSEFENKNIGQLFFNNLNPSSSVFNTFFRITDIDILKYLFSFTNYKINGKVEKEKINSIQAQLIKRSILRTDLIKLLRNFLFTIVHIFSIKSFRKWIEEFNPTTIFFVGSNYKFAFYVLRQISDKYKIPYYIYFTDDYFKYHNGNNFFTKFLHKRFINKTIKIVQGAEELFVISPKMKEEYEDYFGKKCTILINAVDKAELPITKTKLKNPIIFRYFGWLHSNRTSSLSYLAQCLTFINEYHNLNCLLEVYTLTIPVGKTKIDLTRDCIHICQPLMGEELKQKVLTCDFLVHAESFEPEDKRVTMLSISTKIPEYLLSNRCVVAVGPEELASISIFKENNLGIVLSEKKSIETDANEICKVIFDINLYNDFCKKSQEYSKQAFDASTMRKVLKSKLLKN